MKKIALILIVLIFSALRENVPALTPTWTFGGFFDKYYPIQSVVALEDNQFALYDGQCIGVLYMNTATQQICYTAAQWNVGACDWITQLNGRVLVACQGSKLLFLDLSSYQSIPTITVENNEPVIKVVYVSKSNIIP